MKAILAARLLIGMASGIGDEIAISDAPQTIESDREIVDFSYSLTGSSIEDTEVDGYVVYDDGEVISFGEGVIIDPDNLTIEFQATPYEPAEDAVLTIPLWQGRDLQFSVSPWAEPYVRSALDFLFWRR